MKVSFKAKMPIHVIDIATKYTVSSEQMTSLVYLCNEALNNGNVLDTDKLIEQGFPRANINRLKQLGGSKFSLWDSQGALLPDGLQACEDGIIHIPENGKIRMWVFRHPIAGLVPIHVTEENDLPYGREPIMEGVIGTYLENIHRWGRFETLLEAKSITPRWFELLAKYQKGNWSSYPEFSTEATLSWSWDFQHGDFIVEPNFELTGEINGLKGHHDSESKKYISKPQKFNALPIPYDRQSIDTQQKFREWLSTGEFSGSSWDIEHSGMRRPYKLLKDDEKRRHTIRTIDLFDEDIKEWDSISIDDIPLIVANDSDGVEWAHYLLKTLTPGYTSKELTNNLLQDILETPLFCTIDSIKVSKRVSEDLERQMGDPRMQKLLLTVDDLDSSFIVLNESNIRRDKNTIVHHRESRNDYSELLINMAANMKGGVKSVLIIDAHAYAREVPSSLNAFKREMNTQLGCSELHLLTQHYSRHLENNERDENRSHLLEKLTKLCNKVEFTDDIDALKYPHHRYIRIKTDKEERWWSFNDTLLGRLNRGAVGSIIEDPSDLEEGIGQYLKSFDSKNRRE
tara:strand:+ start:2729 stop:4438 length:1710 start_codon:yes stop_codon:yes gene_type:complete